jgi:hypothetical protein
MGEGATQYVGSASPTALGTVRFERAEEEQREEEGPLAC